MNEAMKNSGWSGRGSHVLLYVRKIVGFQSQLAWILDLSASIQKMRTVSSKQTA
jgi:hypothetical protein